MNRNTDSDRSECAKSEEARAERAFYSISEAASLLGVSRVTVWRWIGAGKLVAARLGHRTACIRREDIEAALVPIGADRSRSSSRRTQGAERLHADALLRQKARSLQAEVARRKGAEQ